MDFRPLATEERTKLLKALRGNVEDNLALLTGRDTSFTGTRDSLDEEADEEVVFAIKSIPCHY